MSAHQQLEYKQVWKDEYLKVICAFANADGGRLVIGRADCGEVVGLSNAEKLLEDLPNKVRDVLGIMVDVNLLLDLLGYKTRTGNFKKGMSRLLDELHLLERTLPDKSKSKNQKYRLTAKGRGVLQSLGEN